MRHIRAILFLLTVGVMIAALSPSPRAYAGTVEGGGRAAPPVLLGMQSGSGTLQQATTTPTPNARERLCMSRRADWERNRTPWSLSLGAAIFLASLYLLTYLRFKNTVARVIVSVVAALIFGPTVMAVIVQDAQKVCIDPPGFFGSLAYPMLWWTLGGSLGTLAVIALLRWLVVSRRFRQELPTA